MTAKRLQLSLLTDPRSPRQHLPPEARAKSVALLARMLLRRVRRAEQPIDVKEVRDASR